MATTKSKTKQVENILRAFALVKTSPLAKEMETLVLARWNELTQEERGKVSPALAGNFLSAFFDAREALSEFAFQATERCGIPPDSMVGRRFDAGTYRIVAVDAETGRAVLEVVAAPRLMASESDQPQRKGKRSKAPAHAKAA